MLSTSTAGFWSVLSSSLKAHLVVILKQEPQTGTLQLQGPGEVQGNVN